MLASVPIFFLSLYKAPASIIYKLERMMRDFLWRSSQGKRKNHWVDWDTICSSVTQRGLGMYPFEGDEYYFALQAVMEAWLRKKCTLKAFDFG